MPTLANGLNELRASWEMEDGGSEDDYTRAEERSKEVDGLWDRAYVAEQDGDLRADRDLLRQYLERTAIARDIWFNPKDRQLRRNSAIDRLDVLSALERGSSVVRVRAYLKARRSHDAEKPDVEEIQRVLEQVGSDPNLRDNVAYLKAAELYEQGDYTEAARAFGAIARRHPQSEKREGAVFMRGVALMKASANFGSHDEGELFADNVAGPLSKPGVALDEAGREAVGVFKRLTKENPHGHFVNDARGWLAYLLLHSHDRVGALVEYYRMIGDKRDENARVEGAFSLQLVRGHATDEEMARVELALEGEPDAALAYAYHNIYNYAIDPGPAYPPYNSDEIRDSLGNINYERQRARSEDREKEWQKERTMTGRKEMSRVLDFSRRLLERYPNLRTGGGFALRAAQASLELGDNESAVQFARRAIQTGVGDDERTQALWTNGVAEYRLRHLDVARRNLATLLTEYPSARLVESARRLQAMIAEDAGDINGALEQYIALDYHLDVAYFIDVLMTTDQLAGFIQRHPDSPKTNELVYALGLRYLRANRWDDARQMFARVRITGAPEFDMYADHGNCDYGNVEPGCDDPKEPDYDSEEKPIITARLVMHDIQTANDLERLERAANQANEDEARGEALYQMASYQFEASSLLFYNPIAWMGGRYWNLSQLAGEGRYRAPNETQILWNHMQEHDRLARALKIYLDVANRFPKTRAARDALYTAAVCHERLSNSNPYWRDAYEGGLHAGERMVTYADVKARYPNYQMPRGTYSWQPSTRTVNGGPGWSAPPKPKPRPTRMARIRQAVFNLLEGIGRFWEMTGRRWALVIILATSTIIIGRLSARAREMLRGQIRRQKLGENHGNDYPWMILFQLEPVELSRQERVKVLARNLGQRVWQLACDREGRPVLAVNILVHSFLTWLLVALVQTLRIS
jgi:TolA-binding protein